MGTPKEQSGRFGFGSLGGNSDSQGIEVAVSSRTANSRQLNDTGVLDQWKGLAGVEEEGSTGRPDLVGKEVSSKRPVPVLLCGPVVALLCGIKCLLFPGANLVAEFADND